MVSPPAIPRNALRTQSKGRAGKVRQDRKQRGLGHYKSRRPIGSEQSEGRAQGGYLRETRPRTEYKGRSPVGPRTPA
jgi:hypothetical protein